MLPEGSKFYFSKLTEGEKSLYNHIHGALTRFEPALSVHAGMGKEFAVDMKKILTGVLLDNPAFFYLDRKRIVLKQTPMYIQLCFHYEYGPAQAEQLSRAIETELADFMRGRIGSSMKPLAKQLAVYKYLRDTVRPRRRSFDKDSFSVVGALLLRSCACEGFAKAYKLLCDCLGIASAVVTGEALQETLREPHAWNITRIEGVTAHSDVTWDALAGPDAYDYFNVCDADMAADHVFDGGLYPPCGPNKINYFYRNSRIASNRDDLVEILGRDWGKDRISVKLLFPFSEADWAQLGIGTGTLRFNKAQNILSITKK